MRVVNFEVNRKRCGRTSRYHDLPSPPLSFFNTTSRSYVCLCSTTSMFVFLASAALQLVPFPACSGSGPFCIPVQDGQVLKMQVIKSNQKDLFRSKKKQKRACLSPPCFFPLSLALCRRSLEFFIIISPPPTDIFLFPNSPAAIMPAPSLVHIAPGSPIVGIPLLLDTSSVSEYGASDHFCRFVVVCRFLVKEPLLLLSVGMGPGFDSLWMKAHKKIPCQSFRQ